MLKRTIATVAMALVALSSPVWAYDWDQDGYDDAEEQPTGRNDPRVRELTRDWGIEPGHLPYPCGMNGGNAAQTRNCQRDWDAHNPNDYLRNNGW